MSGRRCEEADGLIWTPTLQVSRVTDLTPARLSGLGVEGLILDLDNTLAPWNDPECPHDVEAWLSAIRAHGVKGVIVSNNGGSRVRRFASHVGLPAVAQARKPARNAFRRGLECLGTRAGDTLVVGDRVLMDVVGGNRAGLRTVLVDPMSRREFWGTRLVRFAEERLVPASSGTSWPTGFSDGVDPGGQGFGSGS